MFGARIAMLRRSMGLSQQDLARRLGVSPSAIGMYEQSRREPPCETIVAMSRLFHVSTDFLLTGEAADDAERAQIRARCRRLFERLDGSLVLRSADGRERPFGEEDFALLLSVILS